MFFRRHSPKTYFAIVCMGRTGATLLQNLLNSHPDIECQGELLNPMIAPYRYFEGTSRQFLKQAYETQKPIRGLRLPYDSIMHHPAVFRDLQELGYRIVWLSRRNSLEHFVSVKLALYDRQRIKVDPIQFLEFRGSQASAEVFLDFATRPFNRTHIDFDDLLDPVAMFDLQTFLGAAPRLLTSSTIKGRTIPVHEAVENYNDLISYFADTTYASIFRTLEPEEPIVDTPEILICDLGMDVADRTIDARIMKLVHPDKKVRYFGEGDVQYAGDVMLRIPAHGRLGDYDFPDNCADMMRVAECIDAPRYTERMIDAISLYPQLPENPPDNPRKACAEALRMRFLST